MLSKNVVQSRSRLRLRGRRAADQTSLIDANLRFHMLDFIDDVAALMHWQSNVPVSIGSLRPVGQTSAMYTLRLLHPSAARCSLSSLPVCLVCNKVTVNILFLCVDLTAVVAATSNAICILPMSKSRIDGTSVDFRVSKLVQHPARVFRRIFADTAEHGLNVQWWWWCIICACH